MLGIAGSFSEEHISLNDAPPAVLNRPQTAVTAQVKLQFDSEMEWNRFTLTTVKRTVEIREST